MGRTQKTQFANGVSKKMIADEGLKVRFHMIARFKLRKICRM